MWIDEEVITHVYTILLHKRRSVDKNDMWKNRNKATIDKTDSCKYNYVIAWNFPFSTYLHV